MNKYFEKIILESTNSKEIDKIQEIQELWGWIWQNILVYTQPVRFKSVMLKMCLPDREETRFRYIFPKKVEILLEMALYKN